MRSPARSPTTLLGSSALRIGLLDLPRFRAFFEPGGVREQLTETVPFAVDPNVKFDLQLLRRNASPVVQPGGGAAPVAVGQNSWLLHDVASRDRDRDAAALFSRQPRHPR